MCFLNNVDLAAESAYDCYDLNDHPLCGEEAKSFHLRNPTALEKEPGIVVWETNRPLGSTKGGLNAKDLSADP
jgi:hypothetical protein